MSTNRHDNIIAEYLVLTNIVRPGVNGPAKGGGWPAERLVLKFPDLETDLVEIGEGSSMTFTREAVRSLLADMIEEAIDIEREACAQRAETMSALEGAHPLAHAIDIAAAIRARK